MRGVAIIGCGFVADLYMRSFATFPDVRVLGAHDRDGTRFGSFCTHWNIPAFDTFEALLAALPPGTLILNLTNPGAHFEVTKACLSAGLPVFSEKPLTLEMAQARALMQLAQANGVMLASAPSSVLGQAAQIMGRALRQGVAGTPRLVYAELDDGFIPQAPYRDWKTESGAPWPYADEFATGCTLEHAGYYLSWLIAWFGAVETVVAASAEVLPDKPGGAGAPDMSVATLFFRSGMVARLTCSIVASHDHGLRVFCDKGVLKVERAWDNSAPVRFHRRFTLRRRLMESPLGRRIGPGGSTHPKVSRFGAASMNFALGPVEMLAAMEENRACRLSPDYVLHLNEVTLAIQNAGRNAGAQTMITSCDPMEPMPWAR